MARAFLIASPSETRIDLSEYLTARGLEIFVAPGLGDARAMLGSLRPDVSILDREARDGDGIDFISEIVDAGSRCLIISSRNEVNDRVRALSLGADDYLAKPINYEELFLRLRNVLLNKVPPSYDRDKYIADLEGIKVDLTTRKILNQSGSPGAALTENELSVLRLLTENIEHIVSREALSAALNEGSYDNQSRAVDVGVSRLRIKLNSTDNGVVIRSVRSTGYILMRQGDAT